jgi:molybdopterin molybdotransferase
MNVPRSLITVDEARRMILDNSSLLPSLLLSLEQASGLVLAEDVYAPVSVPAFHQSGMDGYALRSASLGAPIPIQGEQAAGASDRPVLRQGTAMRIFTGAPVPEGADMVVMQEKTRVENGELIITDPSLKAGDNIRLRGSEIGEGDLSLAKGALLHAGAIGFLAGTGVAMVKAFPKPRVSIIVTGNELQEPGLKLSHGQVYEANSYALRAALKQAGINDAAIHYSPDDPETMTAVLKVALEQSDIVLMTGGVSVGDHDHTRRSAESCGVEIIFHKVKQRPGKPILFGKGNGKLLFGLPGNPASVLTCFYEYVCVALEACSGRKVQPRVVHVPIATDFKKAAGLTHFLKGYYDGVKVNALHAQESYRLSSFAMANCLIRVDESVTELRSGEEVEIHLI